MKNVIFLLFLLGLCGCQQERGHLYILAVSEEGGLKGNIADIFLDVGPGNNQVFLDTFPLTKVDTQMSARFAKEIACNYLEIDCSGKDFFYTLRSDSAIVGGPSAGAATAFLTVAMLKHLKVDDKITLSGTINAGGLVGPVGGLKPKIEAAARINLTKVLIPYGGRYYFEGNESNKTIDLFEYGKSLNIEVKEVSSLDDIVYEFTGKRFAPAEENFTLNSAYAETMKGIANDLCKRALDLSTNVTTNGLILDQADNLTIRGNEAFKAGQFYSAASFCFGASIKLKYLSLMQENLSSEELVAGADYLHSLILIMDHDLEKRELKTITDLQTYNIVKERLIDAQDSISMMNNDTNLSTSELAYAYERYYSAVSWSRFFDSSGTELEINDVTVKQSCMEKLAEAEERYQYLTLILPYPMDDIEKSLRRAYKSLDKKNYKLCLFQATKTKADVDVMLNVYGVEMKDLPAMLEQRLMQIGRNIAAQESKGKFPILGYSYFEYAKSLKDTDISSAFIYSEYALEQTNLDMYFTDKSHASFNLDIKPILYLIIGAALGWIIAIRPFRKKGIYIKVRNYNGKK